MQTHIIYSGYLSSKDGKDTKWLLRYQQFFVSEFGMIGWSFWASLVAQMEKNLPAMQGTQIWSLDQEDPLEKEMATHSMLV